MLFSIAILVWSVVWNRGAVPCQVLEDVQNHPWTALLDILVSQKTPTSQVISLEREDEQHFEIPRVLGNQIRITVSWALQTSQLPQCLPNIGEASFETWMGLGEETFIDCGPIQPHPYRFHGMPARRSSQGGRRKTTSFSNNKDKLKGQ